MKVIDLINADFAMGNMPGYVPPSSPSENNAALPSDNVEEPTGTDGNPSGGSTDPSGTQGSDWGVAVVRIVGISPILGADAVEVAQFSFEDSSESAAAGFPALYPVVVRKGTYAPGDKAVYCAVDSVFPDAPEFSFLGSDKRRLRAKRIRGVYSEGLLVPWSDVAAIVGRTVPDSFGDDAKEIADKTGEALAEILPCGADVAAFLGVTRYVTRHAGNPSAGYQRGGKTGIDESIFPYYSVSNARKGEGIQYLAGDTRVIVTEKLHGANIRFGWVVTGNGSAVPGVGGTDVRTYEFQLGSHRTMRASPGIGYGNQERDWFTGCAYQNNLWSKTAQSEGIVFYGEVLGVQDMTYGVPRGQLGLRIFDAYNANSERWMHWSDIVEACRVAGLNTVPVLYDGPLNECDYVAMAEGATCLDGAAHVREGVVVRTFAGGGPTRRWKCVGQGYKLRKNGKDLVTE